MAKPETRYDRQGRLVSMAVAKNWRMVRRPGAVPSVIFEKDWQAMSASEWTAEMIETHDAEEERRQAGMREVMQFLVTGKMPEGATVRVHRERNPLKDLTTRELKALWDRYDGTNAPNGYLGEDIHAELNRRGDGAYCAV